MKNLKILAVVNPTTNTQAFSDLVRSFDDANLRIETDIEKAIDATNQKNYDLLVLDRALLEADFKKLNRLAELIHPDAAIFQLNFNDEEFIRFKMSGLFAKWQEAQSDSQTNFIDGMSSL